MKRLSRHEIVVIVLREANDQQWSQEFTARVILAQLAQARCKRGIVGPCVYCGTWLASSVDHQRPQSRGGNDGPENTVSACVPCNSAKGDRTVAEWQAAIRQAAAAAARAEALGMQSVPGQQPWEATPLQAEERIGLPAEEILALAAGGSVPYRDAGVTILVHPDDVAAWVLLEAARQQEGASA